VRGGPRAVDAAVRSLQSQYVWNHSDR